MTYAASRREFLRRASAFAAAGIVSPYAMGFAGIASASAQNAADYKALVYVNMAGGNDHLSSFIPFDNVSYDQYAKVRQELALGRASLRPLSSSSFQEGRQISLSPEMAGIRDLYNAGRVAIVSNIGPLIQPTTRADIDTRRAKFPWQIGSHLNQANLWATLNDSSSYGWGGRMADIMASNNAYPSLSTISVTGSSRFGMGANISAFTVAEDGIPQPFFQPGSAFERGVTGSAQRTNLLEKAYTQAHETLRDGSSTLSRAILPDDAFSKAPGGGQNELANGLRTIARLIGGSGAIGARRQIFYVELQGFDTHDSQNDRHPRLMKKLNDALVHFDALLGEIGLRNNVTLFTTSEFGRAFTPNGSGTDHGWGAHHLVMGGGVKGGNIYGKLPVISVDSSDLIFNGGPMLPSTSASQYAATLGKWMGIKNDELRNILPDLENFGLKDLGFMK